jgi:hypothetical protein
MTIASLVARRRAFCKPEKLSLLTASGGAEPVGQIAAASFAA